MAMCEDCDRPYGDEHGFPDLVIPLAVWKQISTNQNETGLLCPSCICKRLYDKGIENCPGSFMSGPIDSYTYDEMHALRVKENNAIKAKYKDKIRAITNGNK